MTTTTTREVWHPADWPRRRPRIAHFMPYLFGDSLAAIRRARRLRFRYIDQNLNLSSDGVPVVVHWPLVRKNRLLYEVVPASRVVRKRGRRGRYAGRIAYRRRGEWVARHRHGYDVRVGDLTAAQLYRLRTRHAGRGRAPRPAHQHMREAQRVGIVLCLEAKGDRRFNVPAPWAKLAAWAVHTNARVVVMTLQNLGGNANARARLAQAAHAGFPVAILPRGPRPVDWSTRWAPLGVAVWGRWRKR